MKRAVFSGIAICAMVLLAMAGGMAETNTKAAGHWEGTIHMSNPHTGESHDVGIAVDLARNSEGKWLGSISVLQSSAIDVPLSGINVEDTAVSFTARLPGNAFFTGHLSADANELLGTASNATGEAPFQLKRAGEANVKIPPPSSALTKEFQGSWAGTAEVEGKAKRVILKLSPATDGTAMGTLVSIDEGNIEIPITTAILKGNELQLEARSVSGKYQGTLQASGEIVGEWSQGALRFPLGLKRTEGETLKISH